MLCHRRWCEKGEGKGLKIDSSTIGMESARSYKASSTTSMRFSVTDYRGSMGQDENGLNASVTDSKEDGQEGNTGTKLGSGQTSAYEEWQSRMGISTGKVSIRSSSNTVFEMRQATVRYIFELLFSGRRNRLSDFIKDKYATQTQPQDASVNAGIQSNSNFLVADAQVFQLSQETYQRESESTAFSTVGTVKTADGREIKFNVNVGMSREFEQYYKEDLESINFQMCDPLVINLNTDVAELSDQKFFFDIDADGVEDEISGLGSGSGYLALDKNGDGTINDGSELFGTASGNGFKDLAEYDEDGNGWIDENDAVWSKLQIWCRDENGQNQLYRLADKGVGAICLQNVATDFTQKDAAGQTKGAIRNTGVFLYENGNVGTVQHVDMAKYKAAYA